MSALPQDDRPPDDASPPAPQPGSDRADWLVGPEEGLAAEIESTGAAPARPEPPKLVRPSAPDTPPPAPLPLRRPDAPPQAERPGMVRPDEADEGGIEQGPGGMVWEPGPRSVPTLSRPDGGRSVAEPTREFPMDDAEERRRPVIAYSEEPPPHEVVAPEAFDVSVPAVPWWMQAAHTLRADRRIQVLVGLALAALVTVAAWPRGERPMSLGNIRRHAATLDGVQVLVSGRVGQVFQVGGGYAYYLHQGRDTLVVFTRVSHPEERQHVTVRGTMSTGYLDGQPTLALFESNHP